MLGDSTTKHLFYYGKEPLFVNVLQEDDFAIFQRFV